MMTDAPIASSSSPNSSGASCLCRPRRRAEEAGALAVAVWAEDGERHRAARDGQKAVAGAIEKSERHCRRGADDGEDRRADRMQQCGDTRRNERVGPAQNHEFNQPRRDLRRADQGGSGDRLHRTWRRRVREAAAGAPPSTR